MAWLVTILIGLLTAVLAAFTSGYVAYACVSWFHISSRDGGDAYLVALIGLLGGVAGFVIGMVTPRFVAALTTGVGFFKAAGMSLGIVLLLVAASALGAWLIADIPPTSDGHLLKLMVEFRLPVGEANPSQYPERGSYILLASSPAGSHTVRKSERGFLNLKQAKQVDGRWVVPGWVQIFTARGERSVIVYLGEKGSGFIVPMSRRPGHRYDQWSEWLPRSRQGEPWSDSQVSYRFRVEPILPSPPPLPPPPPPEDPLNEPHAELARDIRSKDDRVAASAMRAVTKLTVIHLDVEQAIRYVASDIAGDIRRFNAMKPDAPGYVDLGARIRDRFSNWHRAWWTVHQITGADGRPPLQELLALAKVHSDDGFMQEVILNAEAHLKGLEK